MRCGIEPFTMLFDSTYKCVEMKVSAHIEPSLDLDQLCSASVH